MARPLPVSFMPKIWGYHHSLSVMLTSHAWYHSDGRSAWSKSLNVGSVVAFWRDLCSPWICNCQMIDFQIDFQFPGLLLMWLNSLFDSSGSSYERLIWCRRQLRYHCIHTKIHIMCNRIFVDFIFVKIIFFASISGEIGIYSLSIPGAVCCNKYSPC